MQARTLQWMAAVDFHMRTGVDPDHVRCCRECAAKEAICSALRITHCGGAGSNPATAKTRIASRLCGRRGNRINLDSPRLAQRLSSTVFPTPWSNTAALPLAEGVRRRLSVTVLSLVSGPRSTAGKPDAMTTFL